MESIWKEYIGYYPPGLGTVPKRFSDHAWWVKLGTGRVMRMGLGDAGGDLAALANTIAAADSTMAAGQFGLAVTMYQSAGQTGATTVGPEIDTTTNGNSKPLTQQAWAINSNLQSINSDINTATSTDAQSAQGFARQMLNLYQQGLAAGSGGSTATPSQPTPGPLVTPTVVVTGSPGTNWTPWLIGGAAVGGAGLIGYAYWRKHKRGRR